MISHLRRLRQERGLTQMQVAQRAGIDVQRVSLAERALNPRRISIGTGLALADALGVPPAEIMNEPNVH